MKRLLRLLALTIVSTAAIVLPSNQAIDSASNKISHTASTKIAGATQKLWKTTDNSEVWGNSGALMMPFAAQVAASRNPAGQPLTSQQKKYLRPDFGDLVDQVRVNYNAKLLDRWSNGDREVHVGEVDAAAQAFCDRIYIRADHQPQDTAQLVLLAHELTHFQQCLQQGGIQKFGTSYFAAYQQAKQDYASNQFEQAARTKEKQFIKNLCQQINCRNPRSRYYLNYRGVNTKLPVKISPN
jgi:hypothetical protein